MTTEIRRLAPMEVRRLEGERRTWVEPPHDSEWDDATSLRWHAGVVLADSGIGCTIWDHGSHYSLGVGRSSMGMFSYNSAWTFMNGVSAGARELARLREESDHA